MDNRIQERRQMCYKKLIKTDLPAEFVYAYCTEWAEGEEELVADVREVRKNVRYTRRN